MSEYVGYCIQEETPTPDKPSKIKTKVIGTNLLEPVEYLQQKAIETLNNQLKEKNNEIREYELLVFKIERYLNCYQYFLESQEENNKKIANMIHEFSLGSENSE